MRRAGSWRILFFVAQHHCAPTPGVLESEAVERGEEAGGAVGLQAGGGEQQVGHGGEAPGVRALRSRGPRTDC